MHPPRLHTHSEPSIFFRATQSAILMRLTMLSRAFFALLFAAAAGWESGKTCTTDDVRTLAKKDAKLSGTALAECVILDLRGETIAPEMLPRQVVEKRKEENLEEKKDKYYTSIISNGTNYIIYYCILFSNLYNCFDYYMFA